ncbi:hypothetical protein [Altererythrobacter sp. MF3-039]|uniref:hypothetical protein n=1 Tax=Altererythrobacter sp. MF3-039 TaxID=3252901 RepID=UPI00390C9F18
MLVALLSICEESEGEEPERRGLLRFAGKSVAERQIDASIRFGCERIVCLVDGIDSDVIDLQECAKDGGAKFHAVSGCMALLGQVSGTDELLVFGDGVLPEFSVLEDRLGDKPGVLVIPAERAVEEGYERVDAEWAWAGVLRARGSIVEGLAQLPPDSDPISALLRLSLQRGTRVIPLDGAKAMRSGWLLAKSEQQVSEYEGEFLRRYASRSGIIQPMRALADMIAFRIAPMALDRGLSGGPAKTLGILTAAGALLGGYEGLAILGMGLLAFGSFLGDIGRSLSGMMSAIHQKKSRFPWLDDVILFAFDAAFIALAVLATLDGPRIDNAVLSVLVVGLLRLAGQSSRTKLLAPLRDRTLVFTGFAIAAGLGALKPAMAGIALVIVGLLLFVQRRNRLTTA